ncbi:MAG: biopolymer transporter ExbD [Pseudomonadota bacterium]
MLGKKRKIPAFNNVNLIPLLDFIVAVIPVLLLSVSFFEYVSLDTSLPVFSDEDTTQADEDKNNKLGLTIAITDQGFVIAGQTGLFGEGGDKTLIKKDNKGLYDYATLGSRLLEIKNKYPNEWSVILMPESTTKFEEVVSTMDVSREHITIDAKGLMKRKTMFPNVVLGGGVL